MSLDFVLGDRIKTHVLIVSIYKRLRNIVMCEIFPYNELSSFIPSLIGHVVVDDALSMVNGHVTIQKRLIAPKYWVFKAHCAKKV